MSFIENFFGAAGFLSAIIGLTPQIYKAFKTKSTKDIAMFMLINYFIGAILWIVYAVHIGAKFLVWSNIVVLITSFITIAQKIYYDRKMGNGNSKDS